ncbi:MAG: ABC transporter ATP-binding protein [Planctomycetales bacterium]|nr:ABC transporter ATP-binding protein [Planctomycetales bacterium]
MSPAIQVEQLRHPYGDRVALNGLNLSVDGGQIFALLGPNGSGKTTLFRILCTLLPPQSGTVKLLGLNVAKQQAAVRAAIGIVFQAASLDKKLTVLENIRCQATLYGLKGAELRNRTDELMRQLGLTDRANDFAETLSGGLRRRVELAKGMIHRPRLLLLDEPSTGLDPGARADMWKYLQRLRDEFGVTVVLTTHILEEADRADNIAIIDQGQTVVTGRPDKLRDQAGESTISIECDDAASLSPAIEQQLNCPTSVVDRQIRLAPSAHHDVVGQLLSAFPNEIKSVRVGRPTLEDVFIAHTGHQFWQTAEQDD